MKELIRTIAFDQRGIAAVEFAFVAPVFLFMTTAAIDFGYVQLAQSQLQGATQIAAREVIQSKSATSAERKASVAARINTMMEPFPKPPATNPTVVVRKYSQFGGMKPEPYTDANSNGKWDAGEVFTDTNGNQQWDADTGIVDDMGGVGDIVKIETMYPIQPLFSYNAALYGVDGSLEVKAVAVYRNEPD